MKYIKTYREQYNFCNESIKHFLKPKDENVIKDELNNLSGINKLRKIFKYNLRHLISDKEIIDIINNSEDNGILDFILDYNLVHLVSEDKIIELINNSKGILDTVIAHPEILDFIYNYDTLKEELFDLYIEDIIRILFKYPIIKEMLNDHEMDKIEKSFKDFAFDLGDTQDILDFIYKYDLLGFFDDDEINQLENETE